MFHISPQPGILLGIVPLAWLPRQGELIGSTGFAVGDLELITEVPKEPINKQTGRCAWRLPVKKRPLQKISAKR
jgi:hypothetical protein